MSNSAVFAGAMFASAGMIVAILACYVLMIIGIWKMFTKAGEPGWKSLIPIYNGYMLYKMCWVKKMFWVELALGVVYAILYSIGMAQLTQFAAYSAYGYYGSTPTGAIVCIVLAVIVGIAALVINILCSINISKAYGKGGGFAVGLILLPIVFYMILGFGSSQYVGNAEQRTYNGLE